MKTENTTVNKIKFFGLYVYQHVAKESKFPKSPTIKSYSVLGMDATSFYHLELKPLESISDEDAIKVASLLNWGSSIIRDRLSGNLRKGQDIEELKNTYIEIGKDAVQVFGKTKPSGILTTDLLQMIECADYLRSKGYALSWMDLSVQDLIDYGWIKLVK